MFQFNEEPPFALNGCWILADNPTYEPNKSSNHKMVELFFIEHQLVDLLIDRIVEIRGATKALCELTVYLLEQDFITTADGKA